MREQINDEMLEDINGGVMTFSWKADIQTGTVTSNQTGETLTFGRDKVQAVFNYLKTHQYDEDASQMAAVRAIING